MRRGRVSVRAMIAILAVVGLAMGALRVASDLWWLATLLALWSLLAWGIVGGGFLGLCLGLFHLSRALTPAEKR